jgi:hypothetical protein
LIFKPHPYSYNYLTGSNAPQAIQDVIKSFGIIRRDDIDQIHTMGFQNSMAFFNGSCKNGEFQETFPHSWPLGPHASEDEPHWPFATWIELKKIGVKYYTFISKQVHLNQWEIKNLLTMVLFLSN